VNKGESKNFTGKRGNYKPSHYNQGNYRGRRGYQGQYHARGKKPY
jgi:hypothetical protein